MELIDNINKTLVSDLKETIKANSKISIAASCFSIYAYQELKEQLENIDKLQFIFTSPTFTTEKAKKEKREFYIPKLNRERSLYGTEFEVKLRNELSQKAIAKECAEWIRNKVTFKSNVTNENMMGFINVDDKNYMPIQGFSTSDLGCEKGNNAYNMEEMNSGISIMDFGLNEFRLDLLQYIKDGHSVEHTPFGLHAVVYKTDDLPEGIIFVLKNRSNSINIKNQNRLHPFYMVYIKNDGEIEINHLESKKLLDTVRFLCRGKSEPIKDLCDHFNRETKNGRNMKECSQLLSEAIDSIIENKEVSDIDSFLNGNEVDFKHTQIKGLDDFELICFFVVKGQ